MIKKNKKSIVSVLLISLLLIATVTACGGNPLERIVAESQKELPAIQSMLGNDMKIEITARDESTLVYTFTYLIDIGDRNMVRSNLQTGIETQNAVYESLLQDLSNARVPSPRVVVEYIDKDGAEIFSKTYR